MSWTLKTLINCYLFPQKNVFPRILPESSGDLWIPREGNGTPLQYSCLENPRMEDPGRLQSMELLRVRHHWATSLSLFSFMNWRRKWQPTPVFLPGESQGWGSLMGCHLWGSHRVGHDWSDLAAAAAAYLCVIWIPSHPFQKGHPYASSPDLPLEQYFNRSKSWTT